MSFFARLFLVAAFIFSSSPAWSAATALVTSPFGHKVFQFQVGSTTITSVDTAADVFPNRIAFNSTGTNAFVTENASGTAGILPLDVTSGAFGAEIAVGSDVGDVAVSPDDSRIVVASPTAKKVRILDGTGTLIREVTLADSPGDIAILPDNSKAYVASGPTGANGVLNILDLSATATGATDSTVTVGKSPQGVAVSADGATVYATNGNDDTVSVVQVSSNTVINTFPEGDPAAADFARDVAVSSDGSRLYIVNHFTNTLAILNSSDGSAIGIVTGLNAPANVALDAGDAFALVTNAGSNSISVLDLSNNTLSSVDVGFPQIGVDIFGSAAAGGGTGGGSGGGGSGSTSGSTSSGGCSLIR